ncbi:retrovirus-related pol polyprotein from transposon TNT 1-94 [Tanacetum coccineum]
MNMLNRNCKTSFAKPEFLKKAQRENPRLYDIGCYNDNLALMLAPEYDEMTRLAKEIRSKLSDLIRPFDYDLLYNHYDLFIPQREKSLEQQYFSKESKMSHTSAKIENSKESFNKQTNLLEKRMDESIPWNQTCKSSKELFKIKRSVDTIFDGVEQYYYANHMNAILGVYTEMDEVTNLQCDYLEALEKCERLEKDLSKVEQCQRVLKHFRNMRLILNLIYNNVKNIELALHTKETKRNVSQSVATPLKKTIIADSTNQKPRSTTRKQYEHLIEIILFIVDFGCLKHITGNLKLLSNFVEKFMGTVKFGNDQIAPILGYGDLVKGNDLLTGSRGIHLYSITLQDTNYPNPICLMAKASSSQALLWHHHLSHLNFNTINLLSKYDIVIGLPKFKFVKDHLCSSFVSKSSVAHAADAPDKRQQQNTTPSTSTTVAADTPPLNIQTTPETTSQAPTQAPIITTTEDINQAETQKENAHVEEDEFINIFSTPVHEKGDTSSRYVDSSNMHTFYQ